MRVNFASFNSAWSVGWGSANFWGRIGRRDEWGSVRKFITKSTILVTIACFVWLAEYSSQPSQARSENKIHHFISKSGRKSVFLTFFVLLLTLKEVSFKICLNNLPAQANLAIFVTPSLFQFSNHKVSIRSTNIVCMLSLLLCRWIECWCSIVRQSSCFPSSCLWMRFYSSWPWWNTFLTDLLVLGTTASSPVGFNSVNPKDCCHHTSLAIWTSSLLHITCNICLREIDIACIWVQHKQDTRTLYVSKCAVWCYWVQSMQALVSRV